jgi:superfamily II DNA or RNA helicase
MMPKKKFIPFEEARAIARSLGYKRSEDYVHNHPHHLVGCPETFYKGKGWVSWGDFLGYKTTLKGKPNPFLTFQEARSLAISLGFESHEDYCARRPKNLPSDAQIHYKKDWDTCPDNKGEWGGFWPYFLGIEPRYKFPPFEQARREARACHFKDVTDYKKNRPRTLPADPNRTYGKKGVWTSWSDFLGTSVRNDGREVEKEREERFQTLKEFIGLSEYLSEADLLQIARSLGILYPLRVLFHGKSLSEVVVALKGNEEMQRKTADNMKAAYLKPFEEGDDLAVVVNDDSAKVSAASLRSVDVVASRGISSEVLQRLADSQLARLRNKYIDEGLEVVRDWLGQVPNISPPPEVIPMSSNKTGKFFNQIKNAFLAEVDGAEGINVLEWQLTKDGAAVPPSRMQKMTAYQMTQRRTWGNWAGAGAGKTAAAGLSAYATDSQFTLVIATNSTLHGWRKQLKEAFNGARVVFSAEQVKRGRGMFLILNYEKFQTISPTLIDKLVALKPDMIVLDEVQLIKQRGSEEESLRRAALTGLLEKLPTSKVLCMSATPVINDLSEGISLVEIAKGQKVDNLSDRKTVNNALAVHYELLGSGLRYRPQYSQEMKTLVVQTTISDWDTLFCSILDFEQILTPHRLEAVKEQIQPGTIIYTEYVEGIVDVAMEFVKSLRLNVAKYTGDENSTEREQIHKEFCDGDIDVLVASRAISLGVDGLQERCNRMIFLCLPWTFAAYEQIIGRIYRQGSKHDSVEIIIPQVLTNSSKTTYDTIRWDLIGSKRTLAECATDGVIPNLLAIDRQKVLKQVQAAAAKQ